MNWITNLDSLSHGEGVDEEVVLIIITIVDDKIMDAWKIYRIATLNLKPLAVL